MSDEARGDYDDPGVIGSLGVQTLNYVAAQVIEIGRSSHTAFGDRIRAKGQELAELAAEAARRLYEDRLAEGTLPTEPMTP